MTDGMNLHSFPAPGDEPGTGRPSIRRQPPAPDGAAPSATPAAAPASAPAPAAARASGARPLVAHHETIGQVVEISGSGAHIEILGARLTELANDPDPSVAMSGQVGSQIKIASGRRWLLANVRKLRVTDAEAGVVVAEIDFLGEGDEDPSTAKLVNFKRGITSYPIPGS